MKKIIIPYHGHERPRFSHGDMSQLGNVKWEKDISFENVSHFRSNLVERAGVCP